MTHWKSIVYHTIMHPREGMCMAVRSCSWGFGFLILLAATVSLHFGSGVLWSGHGPQVLPPVFSFMLVIRIGLVVSLWIIAGALTHAIARALRGYGKLSLLYMVLGLSSLPFVLSAPLAVLFSSLGIAGIFLYGLVLVPLYIWSLVLIIMGVREVYYLKTGPAAVSVLAPWLIMPLPVFGALAVYTSFWLGLSALGVLIQMSQTL